MQPVDPFLERFWRVGALVGILVIIGAVSGLGDRLHDARATTTAIGVLCLVLFAQALAASLLFRR